MALGLIAKLLMSGKLKFEGGLISLQGITLNLLPAFFISELTKYFEKEKSLDKFYLISWFWGFVLVGQVKGRFNLKKPEEVYALGMDLAEAMGIGLYKTHDYYPKRYTHFKINSPYVPYLIHQKKKRPIDYFICGAMAGGGCHVHDSVCQNIELKCQLEGTDSCEFLTGTEEELKQRNLWNLANERYDLKSIYKLQKGIFEKYKEGNEEAVLDKIMEALR